jgi:hypothetical protein
LTETIWGETRGGAGLATGGVGVGAGVVAGVTAGAGTTGGGIGADEDCFGAGTLIAGAGVSGTCCSTEGVTGALEIGDGFATWGGWTVATGAVGG